MSEVDHSQGGNWVSMNILEYVYMDLILRSEKYVCMLSLRCENYHSSACCCDRELSEMDDDMDLNIVRSAVQ